MADDQILVCPDCGKRQPAENVACWLCGRPLGPEHVVSKEQADHLAKWHEIGKESDPQFPGGYAENHWAILVLWLLIAIGFCFAFPVLHSLIFVVLTLPPVILFLKADRDSHGRLSIGFLSSLIGAALIGLGLIIALGVACFALLSNISAH